MGRRGYICVFLLLFTISIGCGIAIKWAEGYDREDILREIEGYKCKKIQDCDIYYTQKDNSYMELAALQLSDWYDVLESDFGIRAEKPIIIICPNERELKRLLGGKELAQAPIGAYRGGVIYILSPWCYEGEDKDRAYEFMKNGALLHELVHYMVDIRTEGRAERWFSEGVALYYEYKLMGVEWHKELKAKAESVDINMLREDFFRENESLAYRKCFDIVKNQMMGRDRGYIAVLCDKHS